MSAFILSSYHLSVLGRAASAVHGSTHGTGIRAFYNEKTARLYTQTLYEENVRSVAYLYHEPTSDYDSEVVFDERALHGVLNPIQVIKAAISYSYQACETDNYRSTKAAEIIDQIITSFVSMLPGYDAAQWTLHAPVEGETR